VTLSAVPRELPLRWTGSLISFYDRAGAEVLGVRQWGGRVVVSSGPEPYAGAPSAFAVGRKTLVTVTAGAGGIRIYADGRPSGGSERPFQGLDSAVCFVLGTSPEGRHPWQGSIDRLALWERSLAMEEAREGVAASAGLLALYDFKGGWAVARNAVSEDLHITVPGVFRPVRRVLLAPLYEDRGRFRFDPGDAAVNVAGFVPIGLLAFFLRPGKRTVSSDLAFAVSVGFVLSLAIEIIQVFLPGRFSHLTDLGLNTSGAAAGAYLAALLEKMKKGTASID